MYTPNCHILGRLRFISVLFVICSIFLVACGGSGDGGSGNPEADDDGDGFINSVDVDDDNDGLIEISSLQMLDWMRNDLAGTSLNDGNGNVDSSGCPVGGCNGYELVADLDFDTNGDGVMNASDAYFDYDGPGSATGWLPVGTASTPFQANFNGNGHVISNLYIDRAATYDVGLFGSIDGSSNPVEITNVHLDGPWASVTGGDSVGGLVGLARSSVTFGGNNTSGDVNGKGNYVGGLVGYAEDSITFSDNSASGTVTGNASYVGGLAGYAQISITISDNSASGNVNAKGDHVGGLVGTAANSVTFSGNSASGDVTGAGGVGGLVGNTHSTVTFTNNSASGDVNGKGDNVGGLVGIAQTSVTFSGNSASGTVTGNASYVGGLVGYATNSITFSDNSASGDVVGAGSVGGLIGYALRNVTVNNSYATGNINATGDFIGGLFGRVNNSATDTGVIIQSSFATSAVASTGSYVGGLVGISYNLDVDDTFATGSVDGVNYVGGLIGDANQQTSITKSFAVNDVTGTSSVGSFVGWSDTVTYESNYFSTTTTPANGVGTLHAGSIPAGALNGLTTVQLQCPTRATDPACSPTTLYADWDSTSTGGDRVLWNYGTSSQLPGLILDGVVYRDADGDGVLDSP